MEIIEIEKTKNGVYLNILQGDIEYQDIIKYIAENDVEAPITANIKNAYINREKKYKIADYYGEVSNICNHKINISEDKLTASINFISSKGRVLPQKEEILKMIKNKRIKFGIIEENIDKIITENIYNKDIIIAKGIEPKKGKDAFINYFVSKPNLARNLKPFEDENGSVDFKNLGIVENIKKGQILGEKIEAEKGENGINVYGEEIYAEKGRDIIIETGENTFVTKNNKIISEIDGVVDFYENKIKVVDMVRFEDVGIKTGNIIFQGTVIVDGDVNSEYSIKAGRTVKIFGNVEKSNIDAIEDIYIHGSCFGKNYGSINSGRDIFINFANNMKIFAEKNIAVSRGLVHCDVYARGDIVAISKSSKIIGGTIKSEKNIEILNIGSELGINTIVEIIGNDKNITRLLREEEKIDSILLTVEKNIDILKNIQEKNPEKYSNTKEELYIELIKNKLFLIKEKLRIQNELKKIKENENEKKQNSIKVYGNCYPGVKIIINERMYKVEDIKSSVKFYLEKDRVKIEKMY